MFSCVCLGGCGLDLPGFYPTLMRGAANPANPSSLFWSSQRDDDDDDDDTHRSPLSSSNTTKTQTANPTNHLNKTAQRNPKTQNTENLHLNTHELPIQNINSNAPARSRKLKGWLLPHQLHQSVKKQNMPHFLHSRKAENHCRNHRCDKRNSQSLDTANTA